MRFPIEIPRPSKFVKHSTIDEIANAVANAWKIESGTQADNILDIEDFVASALGKEFHWEDIEEPSHRTCFASLDGDRVILNRKHEKLFRDKPFLLRSCLGHEAGHEILRHSEKFGAANQPGLFGDGNLAQLRFHDSSLRRYDHSNDEYLKTRILLARKAAADTGARELLAELDNRLEPEWMFYQAEQFASCFLIPKDSLISIISKGVDLTDWPNLYSIAEQFGTSISMVCVRLQKLNLIAINGNIITIPPRSLPLSFDE